MLGQLLVIALTLATQAQWPAVGPRPETGFEPGRFEEHALVAFNSRIDAYMRVHREVEESVAARWSFDNPEDMISAVRKMRSGIQAVRAHAAQGDIFTGDAAVVFRARLKRALAECNVSVEEVLASLNEERGRGVRAPHVNGAFPWELGVAMPPGLLALLPPLPDELQYRLVDRSLVLIDVHADLVVDILPAALPPAGQDGGAHHP